MYTEDHAFNRSDRRRLARALSRATRAREYRRVAAVLAVAEVEAIGAVATQARVARAIVDRRVERYLATRQPSVLADAPRSGRPRMRALSARRFTV